jgi:hypothetical protein
VTKKRPFSAAEEESHRAALWLIRLIPATRWAAGLEYAKFFAAEFLMLQRAVVDLVVAIAATDEPRARPHMHHQIGRSKNQSVRNRPGSWDFMNPTTLRAMQNASPHEHKKSNDRLPQGLDHWAGDRFTRTPGAGIL